MSTTTETERPEGTVQGNWIAGVVGGVAGAAVMTGLIFAMNDAVLAVAIPALYGLAPPASAGAGAAVHLFHGAVLGVVFAAIAGALDAESTGSLVGLGVAWGVVTWVVLAALVMPLWLSAVGFPNAPPFPNFALPSLLWHGVYGLVLGGAYAGLQDRI